MKPRVDYEARFHSALRTITAYMAPERLRRDSERTYGLSYEEALEMAYENVLEEARAALRGYRRPRIKAVASGRAPLVAEEQTRLPGAGEPT